MIHTRFGRVGWRKQPHETFKGFARSSFSLYFGRRIHFHVLHSLTRHNAFPVRPSVSLFRLARQMRFALAYACTLVTQPKSDLLDRNEIENEFSSVFCVHGECARFLGYMYISCVCAPVLYNRLHARLAWAERQQSQRRYPPQHINDGIIVVWVFAGMRSCPCDWARGREAAFENMLSLKLSRYITHAHTLGALYAILKMGPYGSVWSSVRLSVFASLCTVVVHVEAPLCVAFFLYFSVIPINWGGGGSLLRRWLVLFVCLFPFLLLLLLSRATRCICIWACAPFLLLAVRVVFISNTFPLLRLQLDARLHHTRIP